MRKGETGAATDYDAARLATRLAFDLTPSFRKLLQATALVAALAAALASPAHAQSRCGQQVIDDWADGGGFDREYPLHCYRNALANLPADAEAYTSAPDDIRRELQRVARGTGGNREPQGDGEGGSGGGGGTGPSSGGGGGGDGPGSSVGGDNGSGGDGEGDESEATPGGGDGDDSGGLIPEAIDRLGPGDARSLPLPILILALLALLLIAFGAAGLLARRFHWFGLRTTKTVARYAPPPRNRPS